MGGWLSELIAQWTDGRLLDTSDQPLDGAAGFQEGFRTYLPLYNDYTGSALSLSEDIQRPYDELREIDFARLSDVAQRCATVGDDLEEQLEEVNTQVGTVNGWSGAAADAFRSHIQQFQTAAQTIDEDLEAIAKATGEAVPAAQRVISEYVDAIGDIDFSGFDQPGDIQFMIDVERMLKSVGDVISAVMDWLGDLIGVALPLPGGGGGLLGMATNFVMDRVGDVADFVLDALGMSIDGFLEWIASKVREYLDASFKAPFEANLQLLNDAVEAAKTGVQDAFQPIIDAASAVHQNPFAALPVPPEGNPHQPAVSQPPVGTPGGTQPGGTPDGGQPGGGTPGGVQPFGGPPTGTQPGATPAGGSSPNGVPNGIPVDTLSGPPAGTPSGAPAGTSGGAPPDAAQGGTPTVPVDLPQPDESLAVTSVPENGDEPATRPSDLPPGAGWIADPSQLPGGWTIDPQTGELQPPGAPGGWGDPEVHSPEGGDILDGDGEPGHGGPMDGTPTSISIREGDATLTVCAGGGPDGGIGITMSDGEGHRTEYLIEVGQDGRPELVPAATVAAAVGFVGSVDPAAASAGGVSGVDQGVVSGVVSGEPSAASPGHPGSLSAGGQMASGTIDAGHGADSGAMGTAQLATVGDAGAPGSAQLATVGDDPKTGQHTGAGVPPMMPMAAGTVSGGDEERRGGSWHAPASEVFDADEPVIRGVVGEDG